MIWSAAHRDPGIDRRCGSDGGTADRRLPVPLRLRAGAVLAACAMVVAAACSHSPTPSKPAAELRIRSTPVVRSSGISDVWLYPTAKYTVTKDLFVVPVIFDVPKVHQGVAYSRDGGHHLSAIAVRRSHPEPLGDMRIAGVGSTAFLLTDRSLGLARNVPVILRSDDRGRTFRPTSGVDRGVGRGKVSALTAIGRTLVVGGAASTTADDRAAVWRSTDDGRTWSAVAAPPGPEPSPGTMSEVVSIVAARRSLVALVRVATSPQANTTLWRSVDEGRTWTSVPSVTLGEDVTLERSAGGEVAATSAGHDGWASSDDGRTWRRLGRAPNAFPYPRDLSQGGTALTRARAFGDVWLATATTFVNEDEQYDHLLRSHDGGRHWTGVQLGQRCTGTSPVSEILPPVLLSSTLVTTVSCSAEDRPPFAELWTSIDHGKTWRRAGRRLRGTLRLLVATARHRALGFQEGSEDRAPHILHVSVP